MTTQPKYVTWPILGPLLLLLARQEVILSVFALLVNYLIWLRPELEEARVPLMFFFSTLVGLILTGQLGARLDGMGSRWFWANVFRPFRLILQSRKFWVAVFTLAFDTLVVIVPELEPMRLGLITAFTAVGLGLMTNIAWEDTSRKDVTPPAAEQPVPGSADLRIPDTKSGTVGSSGETQRLSDAETVRVANMVRSMLRGEMPDQMSIDDLVEHVDSLLHQRGFMIVPNPNAPGPKAGEQHRPNPPLAMVG